MMAESVFSMDMLQAIYYGLVMTLTMFFCGAFLRGFFVNYFKVRTSFGKLVMVKVRSPLRDYFARGEVQEGFLIYKIKRGFREYDTIRLNIPPGKSVFYKCLSVVWVDVDDEQHAICKTDYSAVEGYDAVKNNNLHVRALMKPSIATGQEKIMLVLIIVAIAVGLFGIYMSYTNAQGLAELQEMIPRLLRMSGTVTGGATV